MADSMHFRPPGQLNITAGNIAENFRKWKQQLKVFMTASGADDKDDSVKKAIILNLAGEDVMEVSNHFIYAHGENEDDPNLLLTKIEAYCSPKKSEVYESYKFWTAPIIHPIDQFVADLRTRAKNCNFGAMTSRLIRDKVVFTLTDPALKTRLMRDQEILTLTKLIDVCRAHEMAQGQIKDMSSNHSSSISHLGAQRNKRGGRGGYSRSSRDTRYSSDRTQNASRSSRDTRYSSDRAPGALKICLYCNLKHNMSKYDCPAYGKTCNSCKEKNHFPSGVKCPRYRKVRIVSDNSPQDEQSAPEYDYHGESNQHYDSSAWIGKVTSSDSSKRRLYATMGVNGSHTRFQLDSGAEVNTICKRHISPDLVKPTRRRLTTWDNKTVSKPVGEADIELINPVNKQMFIVAFHCC